MQRDHEDLPADRPYDDGFGAFAAAAGVERDDAGERPRNDLLAALSPAVYGWVAAALEPVTTTLGQVLLPRDEPATHVYFPTAGMYSMVEQTPGGAAIEVAVIGREGFVGVPVLLAVESSPEVVICQVAGAAVGLPVAAFRAAVAADERFARAVLRYTQAMISMIAQASACNRLHNVEERAARWLLLTHDRVDGDAFALTQEFLAQMLGVRRQAVNVAVGILARAGLIGHARGEIRVIDRAGLEGAACPCYAATRGVFARLLG